MHAIIIKYLGHFGINEWTDIEQEHIALSVRANMLAHRFVHCSTEAKITLFRTYCATFYTNGFHSETVQCSACVIQQCIQDADEAVAVLQRVGDIR